ncbi:MAG TPA: LemA family protein [Candidatus Acidoferrales bacterium]|nr:LemA family protein [Candidatus Acidoferrales bacterium]
MSRGAIIVLSIVAFLVLICLSIAGCGVANYNKLVSYDENVKQSWGQVENQYQRRYDLIPNLVETVKGYAKHEEEVFEKVAEARSSVGKLTVTPEILNDPQAFGRFQQAQDALSSALTRLMAVSENYPNLKADQNFLALQSQLEGTENRIAVERQRFNQSVQSYNTLVRRMPSAIIASLFGFHERPYFEAQQGASTAPKVQF